MAILLRTNKPPDPEWRNLVAYARESYAAWTNARITSVRNTALQGAERTYVDLIVRTFTIRPEQIWVASREESVVGSSYADFRDHPDGKLNLDLDDAGDHAGLGGIGHLPSNRVDSIPRLVLVLNVGAFDHSSSIFTFMTIQHELTHVSHARRGIELLNQWRLSGDRRDFTGWLREQLRRLRISQIDYDFTDELTRPNDRKSSSQSLAHLGGFIAGFNLLSPSHDAAELFGQLEGLSLFWTSATRTVEESVINELSHFYEIIDESHKQSLVRYISMVLNIRRTQQSTLQFYERLRRALLSSPSRRGPTRR